jgi:transcriptional regulator with XRE-family HTH domain
MPFQSDRLRTLREAKGWSQQELAKRAKMSQSAIAKSESGNNLPGSEILDKLAQTLECTIDYLHGRGRDYESPEAAASHMAFEVAQKFLSDEQLDGCRRVLSHSSAPRTAEAWRSFAEMFALAAGSKSVGPLALLQGPRPKAMGVARHHRNQSLIK